MRARTREAITLTDNTINYSVDHSESGLTEDTDTSHPLQAGASVQPDSLTFADLGVHPLIVRALHEAGIQRTFAIQELTLPLALAGDDLIGQARTGMGKTLGFGVPLLQRLTLPGDGTPQALVVVPTRELCLQVTHDLADAGRHLDVRVVAVYGGRPYEQQTSVLRRGVDVVVGTPGRLLDLAEQRHLVLGKVRTLVLDEADEMLDLGFLPDVERILRMVPDRRQTMLFSATMPGPIITLARAFLHRPTHIRAEENDAAAIHELTAQYVYRAHALDKIELLARVLQASDRGLTMIFARTKRTAQKVADELGERGFAAAAVHGDLGQGAREQALRAFRTGKIDVLVATDVAARGIDVDDVTHVVNYQCPEDEKTYVHRIGRTGRAGKTGVAITLVDWDELTRWRLVDTALRLGMPEPVETYSSSPHLHAELSIPAGVTGRLPLAMRTRPGLAAEPEEDLGGRRRRRSRRGAADEISENKPRRTRLRKRTRGANRTDTPDPASAPAPALEPVPYHREDVTSRRIERGNSTSSDGEPAAPAESGRTRPRRRRRRGNVATGAGDDTAVASTTGAAGGELVMVGAPATGTAG